MSKNIYEIVEEKLKENMDYIAEDGKLLKAKVYSDVMTMNKNLLNLLLSDEKIRKTFFTKIDDLCEFLTNNQAEFDTIKELFNENESKGQEEIFKTYCSNNRRFQLPTIYENAVAKRLGISIEMAR